MPFPLVVAFLAGLLVAGVPDTSLAAIVADPNCAKNDLPPTDDDFKQATLGFTVAMGGAKHETVFIDNNGFISLGTRAPRSLNLLERTDYNVIAAFVADMDTRHPNSDVVTYGQTTYAGRPAFCVNWGAVKGVGHYHYRLDYLGDKRNKLQLILVNRDDRKLHDFDVILNYDQVQWDQTHTHNYDAATTPTQLGVTGHPLPGSGVVPSGLLDGQVRAITAGSQGSPVPGRYIFEFHDQLRPTGAVVSGTLYRPDDQPLAGAVAQFCRADGKCAMARSDVLGRYSIRIFEELVDGSPFTLSANPPAGTTLLPLRGAREIRPVLGSVLEGIDAVFDAPMPFPEGTLIEPLITVTAAGTPVVHWKDSLHITTVGCRGGTATYTVYAGADRTGEVLSSGPMLPDPRSGTQYEADVPALYPYHGVATVVMQVTCTNGIVLDKSFPIYIDPSGHVRNANGNPIRGARVTLYRSDYPEGPFELVPDGSAIMSPANRTNPMYSDARGYFGWDTLAGYYVVRAEKAGCTAVGRADRPYTETGVLPVPPPVTDLDLRLDCGAIPPPALSVPSSLAVEAQTAAGAVVTYEASAVDAADGSVPVRCLPASGSPFPFGTTAVTCTAMNSYGNVATTSFPVTVADTQPPVLTLPGDLSAYATSAAGASVTYAASAVDALDGVIAPLCTPPSGATFVPGASRALCTATDSHGNSARGTFSVLVSYEFGGLLPPLSGTSRSTLKQGQVIPVRFTLTGASAGISTLAARLFVAKVVGDGVNPEVPAVSAGGGTTGNLFRPVGSTGAYQFLLSTSSMAPGAYWLRIELGDGVIHAVPITLTN
jgi:hypothetical protein